MGGKKKTASCKLQKQNSSKISVYGFQRTRHTHTHISTEHQRSVWLGSLSIHLFLKVTHFVFAWTAEKFESHFRGNPIQRRQLGALRLLWEEIGGEQSGFPLLLENCAVILMHLNWVTCIGAAAADWQHLCVCVCVTSRRVRWCGTHRS